MTTGRPAGVVPVGCGMGWVKRINNISGTFDAPPLPNEYVECNGQVLSDKQSIYDTKTIPDFNGAISNIPRFLRGSTTSGTQGGAASHTHTYTGVINHTTGWSSSPCYLTCFGSPLLSAPNNPSNYGVFFILRVK